MTSVLHIFQQPLYYYRGNIIVAFDSYEEMMSRVQFLPSEYLEFLLCYYGALGVVSHATSKTSHDSSKESSASTHLGRKLMRIS